MDTSIMQKTDRQAFHYIGGVFPKYRRTHVPRYGATTLGGSVSACLSILAGNVISLFELFHTTFCMFVLDKSDPLLVSQASECHRILEESHKRRQDGACCQCRRHMQDLC